MVRHGESRANAEGVAGGPLGDGGLTELGRRQATALADRLARSRELDAAGALYTSTLPRAIETAQIVRTSLPVTLSPVAEPALCEIGVGEGDGLTWAEFVKRFGSPDWDADPYAVTAPGGESLMGFYGRCVGAIDGLIARHPDQLVVLVVHGGFIEQAMKVYLGVGGDVRLRPRIENCSMTEIEFANGGMRLLRYNDLAPLDAE
jgi:probable phosphoglycerate mutase